MDMSNQGCCIEKLLVASVEGLTRVVERLAGFKLCGKFRGFQPWSFKGFVYQ